MESTKSRTARRQPASPGKLELIIEAWDRAGRGTIGEAELRDIQRSLSSRFGQGAEESPAALARVLADAGAELRHPEVIEFDARWREAKLEHDGRPFKGFEDLLTGRPLRLNQAEVLIKKLEKLRRSLADSGDQTSTRQLLDMAVSGREIAELLATDRKLGQAERAEQAEIAEWFKVWIQTPTLFRDWLDLRLGSVEFQEKFSSTEVAP